jgi:hypothetical protein
VTLTMSLDQDALLERVSAGGVLSATELTSLAASPDILAVGMLADAVRRRLNGGTVTFVRVHLQDINLPVIDADIPPAAREVRLSGSPASLTDAVACISTLKAAAGERTLSGLSWGDVDRWSLAHGGHRAVLKAVLDAGLDAIAEVPLDVDGVEQALDTLSDLGFRSARLTIGKAASIDARLPQFFHAAALSERFPVVRVLSPLPLSLNPLRPTTGYDDVKAVALARIVAPRIPHVQVDWLRYGPKLAQVVLTFGADDLDNVSPSAETPDGRRRAVVEELRRNIEAAGFVAVERDGRFGLLA